MLLDDLTPEELSQAFLVIAEEAEEDSLPPKLQSLSWEDWNLLQNLLVNLMVSKELSTLH